MSGEDSGLADGSGGMGGNEFSNFIYYNIVLHAVVECVIQWSINAVMRIACEIGQ